MCLIYIFPDLSLISVFWAQIITEHVYELLETTGKLKRHTLSTSDNCPARSNDLETFVFVSDDVFTNKDKLIVLLHGSGVVRAGQWARRYIFICLLYLKSQLNHF